MSLTEENVYEQLDEYTRGLEAGTLRVRYLGEEVGRGRENICLAIGGIIAVGYKRGNETLRGNLPYDSSRQANQRASREAWSRAMDLVPILEDWATSMRDLARVFRCRIFCI